jgi:peroxiredoxin
MKNRIALVLLVLNLVFGQFLMAQQVYRSPKLLIKGRIDHFKGKSWSYSKTGYFDNTVTEVPVDSAGRFEQAVAIEGQQELYLYLNNDAITIYVQPDDTIQLCWDEDNFVGSFNVKSPNVGRNRDLQLNLELYRTFRKEELALSRKLWEERNTDDSVKFRWINDLYNRELKVLLGEGKPVFESTALFTDQVYYKYTQLLMQSRLLDKFALKADLNILGDDSLASLKNGYIPESASYRIINDVTFYRSPRYRDFLFDYVRNSNELFVGTVVSSLPVHITSGGDTLKGIPGYANTRFYVKANGSSSTFTPAIDDYYQGLSQVKIPAIKDWFITKSIFFSFRHYSLEDVETVLEDFLPSCRTDVYRDTLIAFRSKFLKFKKGSSAMEFQLKDENGKLVSLSDFKGKAVYLDFWGVSCGPCINDIRNYVPKLHEKYHNKDIVFVNICVDADEAAWKKAMANLKLDGVNLIAEGWTSHPVCGAYNINSIPHYVLIDKDGKFKNYNASGPRSLIRNEKNEIDEVLSKE